LSKITHGTKVLTFGEPLIAWVPSAPGVISVSHQFRPYAAGAELNTATGLARLGIPVAYACGVGQDPFGTLIRKAVQAEGVDAQYVEEVTPGSTGVFFKQWTGLQASTSVFYYRSTSPMAIGSWEPEALYKDLTPNTFAWVHSTGITWAIGEQSRRHATAILKSSHEVGIPTSFDVNVRRKLAYLDTWHSIVAEVLPYLTWFLLGDEEASLLFHTESATVLETAIRNLGFTGEGVLLKRGIQGAELSCRGEVTRVPAKAVTNVVDTVGAGDGFNAGWIAGMLRDWSIEDALRLGAVVGAFAVTSVGDHDGYPTWAEALQELDGRENVLR
jgi:2-dehydro-3-deoxygluconokinase